MTSVVIALASRECGVIDSVAWLLGEWVEGRRFLPLTCSELLNPWRARQERKSAGSKTEWLPASAKPRISQAVH
jgi:hypothetical protein